MARGPIRPLPSQERLKELFNYDPESGEVTLKFPKRSTPSPKDRATFNGGYSTLSVDGKSYSIHRIIWRWMTGEDPGNLHVDHRDRNKSNNVWSNLRKGTTKQNAENTDAKGIYFNKLAGKWQAQIMHHGKSVYLGTFECPLLGRMAYLDKKKELHEWGW